jgi:hypothetical protein
MGNTQDKNNAAIGQFSLFREVLQDENTAVGGGSLADNIRVSKYRMGREAGMGVANTQNHNFNQEFIWSIFPSISNQSNKRNCNRCF